jgi:hypothetical protein
VKQNKFILLGYDNPLGRYPAPVVPVGLLGDELVAVYPGNESPTYVALEQDVKYIKVDTATQDSLAEFDPQLHRLFAADRNNAQCYRVNDEKNFFLRLLKQQSFSSNNPFLRLSLATVTCDTKLIVRELSSCVAWMRASTPGALDNWYKAQLNSLREHLPEQIYTTIPEDWRKLPSASRPVTEGAVTGSEARQATGLNISSVLFALALITLGALAYVTSQHLKEFTDWIVILAAIAGTHVSILATDFYGNTSGYGWRAARKLWGFFLTFVMVQWVIGILLFNAVISFVGGRPSFALVFAVVIGVIVASLPSILERSLLPEDGLTVRDLQRLGTRALLKLKLTPRHDFAWAIRYCLEQDVYDFQKAGGWGLGLTQQEIGRRLRKLYEVYKADISRARKDFSFQYDAGRTQWEMGFLLVRHVGRKKLTEALKDPVAAQSGWAGNERRRAIGTEHDRDETPGQDSEQSRSYDHDQTIDRLGSTKHDEDS